MKMIKINVLFVHGIELSPFTEKLREIGGGAKIYLIRSYADSLLNMRLHGANILAGFAVQRK